MTTYLITGANRGIGLEFCLQLSSRGENVIATCRNSSEELLSTGVRVEEGIDISSKQSIDSLRNRTKDIKIDVLINNAGILENTNLSNLSREGLLNLFNVNAISPILLSKTLLPNLSRGSKIIFITSRMASISDNTSGGSYGYRMSKVALSMGAKSLAIDLKDKGVAVAILHPGLVSTRMTGFTPNGISPAKSVSGMLNIIDKFTIDKTGTFSHSNGEILPW